MSDLLFIGTGDTPKTVSGRRMCPSPRVDCSNNRKTINSLKRRDVWFLIEARREVASDEWQTFLLKGMKPAT